MSLVIKHELKRYRVDNGFTMRELAEKIGVSEATVSRWESGEISNLKHSIVVKLSKVLAVSPVKLLGLCEGEFEDNHLFSVRLREALNMRRMRQKELAESAGVLKSSITGYLKGEYNPGFRKMADLAKALDVSPAWLAGYDVPMEENKKELQQWVDLSLINEIKDITEIEKVNELLASGYVLLRIYEKKEIIHYILGELKRR